MIEAAPSYFVTRLVAHINKTTNQCQEEKLQGHVLLQKAENVSGGRDFPEAFGTLEGPIMAVSIEGAQGIALDARLIVCCQTEI